MAAARNNGPVEVVDEVKLARLVVSRGDVSQNFVTRLAEDLYYRETQNE
jgi:hypothetical protein